MTPVRFEGGGHLAQGRQGEGPARRRRMGDPQPGRANALMAEGEQVYIEGSSAPTNAGTTAGVRLEALGFDEQADRGALGR